MRKYFLYFVLLNLAVTYLQQSHAQGINSIDILPEQISYQDSIKVNSEVWLEYSPGKLDSVQIFYACGAVAVNAFYSSYFDPDSCVIKSEIDLGRFPNGFYAFTFNMYYLGYTLIDTYQGDFTVGNFTGNEQHLIDEDKAVISPNPNRGNFWLNLDKKTNYDLYIFNMNGSTIYHKRGSGKKNVYVESGLEKGFYFYRLQDDRQTISGKVIITQ